jgi:hypothetical protein
MKVAFLYSPGRAYFRWASITWRGKLDKSHESNIDLSFKAGLPRPQLGHSREYFACKSLFFSILWSSWQPRWSQLQLPDSRYFTRLVRVFL